MALNFQPAEVAVQEMGPWKLESPQRSFKLAHKNPKYAVILVMAGDDPTLGGHVISDLKEIQRGVQGNNEVSVLVLADFPCTNVVETVVYEFSAKECNERTRLPSSIDTGDPRPIAQFLTMALNSFAPETRIALGFWGHGDGVAHDHLDPRENLIPEVIRKLPLGSKITKTMFLKHYLAEPAPVKPKVFKSMLPDASSKNRLTNRELSSALTVAFSRSGRSEPVDMIFFDTCLNGTVEVFSELRRYAKTFVASSILVSETGWDYTNFLKRTREKLPSTPTDWAKQAIDSWHRAYGYGYSPDPAQLAAFNCESDFLSLLKSIVDLLEAFPNEEQEIYAACKLLKGVVGQDESVDLNILITALGQATGNPKLREACLAFHKSFEKALIGVSTGPANPNDKSALSVWFPRMGDKFQIAGYYQNYRFHKETGWLNIVNHLLRPATKSTAPPVFFIIAFRGMKLINAEPIEYFTYLTNKETELPELFVPHPKDTSWIENLQEGRYSFHQGQSSSYASREEFREFIDVLISIKRKSGEFALLEAASKEFVIANGSHLQKLFFTLMKYREIVHDEFPKHITAYDTLAKYARGAAKDGILIFGYGSYSPGQES